MKSYRKFQSEINTSEINVNFSVVLIRVSIKIRKLDHHSSRVKQRDHLFQIFRRKRKNIC